MVSFWGKLVTSKNEKFSCILYNILFSDFIRGQGLYNWMSTAQRVLQDTGFNFLWLTQKDIITFNPAQVKQRINDQSIQNIIGEAKNSNKGRNYFCLKDEWKLDSYLQILEPPHVYYFIKFITSNHRLPVETGRFNGIDYNNRICPKCCLNDLGDEYHYLFKCPLFKQERDRYIPSIFRKCPSMQKYKDMLSSKNEIVLRKICIFMNIIMKTVRT